MLPYRLLLIAAPVLPLFLGQAAMAQNKQQQGATNRPQGMVGSRTPVATRPSNNPFRNPIGQGAPPAVSANPNLNSNRTNR
jgi:hypothetical protein